MILSRVARFQNLIPPFLPRRGRDQILQHSIEELQSFKHEGPNTYNLETWLQPSGHPESHVGTELNRVPESGVLGDESKVAEIGGVEAAEGHIL